MSKPHKRYSREERLEIVKQSLEAGAVVSQIARKFGLAPNTITRWRQELRLENKLEPVGQGIKALTDEERQIARLRKQLREAELERDILKKAIGIFSKSDGKSSNS
ncbi:transposase [Lewinella sp. IMCC34183]|uniref:transposase n=1 Tax=Lewinella sp. IMCC34183 TaxID=2248762 RepID=UPI000E248F54|nr:transposase [Lewinella sp. IMCC34183]